ncbi:MAG TPA: hypothetical protein VI256_09985, partial [Roseiarcus sp.]
VTRLEAGSFFLSPLSRCIRSAGMEARGRGHAERRIVHGGKLNLFSDFLQEIAISAIPFRLPQSKDHSLRAH